MLNRSVDKIEELKRSGNSKNFCKSKSALKDLNMSSFNSNRNSSYTSNSNLKNFSNRVNKLDLGTLRINSNVYAYKQRNLFH